MSNRKLITTAVMVAMGSTLAACGAASGHTNNSSPNSPSSKTAALIQSIPTSPISGFAPPTGSALRYLKHKTTVPLLAPTSLPKNTLSAVAQGTKVSYAVVLYNCPLQLPLNNQLIGSGNCSGYGFFVDAFGGRQESSSASATAQLSSLVSPMSSGISACAPGSSTSVTISGTKVLACGHGYNGPSEASWKVGTWQITYLLGPAPIQSDVSPLINALKSFQLPPFPGEMLVQMTGTGDHTTLAWAVGNYIYSIGDYHSEVEAARLASVMKRY